MFAIDDMIMISMILKKALLILLLLYPAVVYAGHLEDACNMFREELSVIPYDSLKVNTKKWRSIQDDQIYTGCEIVFRSNERLMKNKALPSFEAEENSKLYKGGWRIDESLRADGPGSGAYGIRKDNMLCIVNWDQFSFVNEQGEIKQSEFINMVVQCRYKTTAD